MRRNIAGILLCLTVLGLAACGDGGGGNGGPDVVQDVRLAVPDLPAFVPPEKNAIVGRVLSTTGQGIEGVTVTSDAGGQATTNYDGYYALGELPAKERIVVTFAADGYVPATRTGAMAVDGRMTVNAVLVPRIASKELPSGAPAIFGHGTVAVATGDLLDKNGQAPAGAVQVRSTPIPTRGPGLAAAPGDFSATTAGGQTAQLETFAMSDFQLLDETGAELEIAPGKAAEVEMLLPADTTLQEGDTVPAWHFDSVTGRWIEEGEGTIVKYSQDPTRLAFKATVAHFSTWNCDKPLQTTCISGTVTKCDGTPAPMADLLADGTSYDGTSRAAAGLDGSFCILAKTSSTVSLAAALGWNEGRLVAMTTVTTGSDPSQCPGPCTTVNLVLPCTPAESTLDCDDTWFAGCRSCVHGRVVDSGGKPRAAVLKASTGRSSFTVVTDSKGEYCAPAPLDSPVTITADGAGVAGAITYTPHQAGACPQCEQAPDLELSSSSSPDEGFDFSDCGTLASMALTSVRANGTAPSLLRIDSGWANMESIQNGGGWQLTLSFASTKSKGIAGSPLATVTLNLPAAPTAGTRIDVASELADTTLRGTAYSAAGTINGLGGDTYTLANGSDPQGSGFVRFDTAVTKVGDPAKGSFVLTFQGDCAPKGATLTLAGTFDVPATDYGFSPPLDGGVDSPEFRAWKCGFFDLFVLSVTITGVDGAVAVTLDDAALLGDTSTMDQAKYSWEDDRLSMSFYGQDTSVSLQVEHPAPGDNLVASGSLILSSSDCYYEVKSGVVTLQPFTGAEVDRWVTGTFDVEFTKVTWVEGNCPDHHVVGQFGAPVCR